MKIGKESVLMNEVLYAKYIITESEPNMPELDFMRTRILFSGDEIIPGALCVNCAWYWKGSEEIVTKAHLHNCDEIIAFMGTNLSDPHDLCGVVEMWLSDEKYLLTKSCLVFAPKGVVHCPLIVREVNRPIFHFTAMTKEGVHFVD
jgi:hypothetical protein